MCDSTIKKLLVIGIYLTFSYPALMFVYIENCLINGKLKTFFNGTRLIFSLNIN